MRITESAFAIHEESQYEDVLSGLSLFTFQTSDLKDLSPDEESMLPGVFRFFSDKNAKMCQLLVADMLLASGLYHPDPKLPDEQAIINFIVVGSNHRKQKLGLNLMGFIERECIQDGFKRTRLEPTDERGGNRIFTLN